MLQPTLEKLRELTNESVRPRIFCIAVQRRDKALS